MNNKEEYFKIGNESPIIDDTPPAENLSGLWQDLQKKGQKIIDTGKEAAEGGIAKVQSAITSQVKKQICELYKEQAPTLPQRILASAANGAFWGLLTLGFTWDWKTAAKTAGVVGTGTFIIVEGGHLVIKKKCKLILPD
jgi:hypothetical protein